MKSVVFILFTCLQVTGLVAQTKQEVLMQQINKDIWQPYLRGINEDSSHLYIGVHSRDFIWMRGGKTQLRSMNYQEYVDDALKVMADRKQSGVKGYVDMRFLERHLNETTAAEKAILEYKELNDRKEVVNVSYSIVYFFSKKENGIWKKLIQYGTSEKADSLIFQQAQHL